MPTVAQNYEQSFRGILFPATSWDTGFSQDTNEHKYIFKDEQFIQGVGRKNLTWRASIPLSQNDRSTPDQFVKTFPDLFRACQNRDPGDLLTPDIGTFPAICVSLSYKLSPTMLDGTVVEAQWIHAPAMSDLVDPVEITPSVTQVASAANQIADLFEADFPAEAPKAAKLKSIFETITSVRDQVLLARDVVHARIDSAIFTYNDMLNTVDLAADPVGTLGLSMAIRKAELAAYRTQRTLPGGGEQPAKNTVLSESTIDEVARDLQVSVESLIALNANLAAEEFIAAGTTVYFQPGR